GGARRRRSTSYYEQTRHNGGLTTMAARHSKALRQLKGSLPRGELQLDPKFCAKYGGDKWFAARIPDAVALPTSTASVAKILQFAFRHRLAVTPRGAGFGYVGGCVPVRGGIALSLERMNRIKEINAEDFGAVG